MSGISVGIRKTVRHSPIGDRKIIRLVNTVLHSEGIEDGEVSVAVVGNKAMENLTEEFSGRRYCTDVLSFDLRGEGELTLSAQIIVNSQLARRRASRFGIAPGSELGLYIIHGLLHLLGYDDHNPDEARKMHNRSLVLLRESGFRKLPPAP